MRWPRRSAWPKKGEFTSSPLVRRIPPYRADQTLPLIPRSVPISEISSYSWIKNFDTFLKQSPNHAEMLIKDPETGKLHAPRPGEIFKNPCLAQTFREVAEKGKAGFYEGRVAQAIVDRELTVSGSQHTSSRD